MEQIIHATADDIEEILSVMETGLATTENKEWYVTDDREFIARHVEAEGYTLKYMVNNKIAGFLIVRRPMFAEDNLGKNLPDWTEETLTKVSHMESAAVLPEFRGRKIQKKLLMAAEEIERKQGTEYLMCTVHPDNRYSAGNLE